MIVKTKKSLELLNVAFIPLKLMTLDLNKGFDKSVELEKFTKIIESMKIDNPDEPKLYKILADCLVESKLAKRTKPNKDKEK